MRSGRACRSPAEPSGFDSIATVAASRSHCESVGGTPTSFASERADRAPGALILSPIRSRKASLHAVIVAASTPPEINSAGGDNNPDAAGLPRCRDGGRTPPS